MGSGQIHLQFLGTKVKFPFNGYKTNMQVKDKNKPRYYPRRRNKKGELANKVEVKKEEPTESQAKIKQVWREKEVQSWSPSPGPPRRTQRMTRWRGPALRT